MKYMMLVYTGEDVWAEGEREACFNESRELCKRLDAEGQFVSASPLHPISTATSVRVRNGKPLITDGPFAETTEQLGGYFIVNADNLDDALQIAAQIPGARKGTIEVRPLLELPGVPQSRE